MKITARNIAGLKPPVGKTDVIFFDDVLTGFGIRLRASGDRLRRTWVAQYRAHGRTRRMKLGAVENLTPDQARKAATKVLAKVDLGGDPAGRQERPSAKGRSPLVGCDWSISERKGIGLKAISRIAASHVA